MSHPVSAVACSLTEVWEEMCYMQSIQLASYTSFAIQDCEWKNFKFIFAFALHFYKGKWLKMGSD